MRENARAIVAETLSPMPYDRFMSEVMGKQWMALVRQGSAARAKMLGDDPSAPILSRHASHALKLTCHHKAPTLARPNLRPSDSPEDFRALIQEYHAGGYTVRIPDFSDLSTPLQRFTRALATLILNPVEAAIFWSGPAAEAPVHYDGVDIFVIQLSGRKRWFISNEKASLNYTSGNIGEREPQLGDHRIIDVEPGDLLYLPRGTVHTVQSMTESIHLSIGFSPVTLRDAMIAAIDRLSETDRRFREQLTARADALPVDGVDNDIAANIRMAADRLVAKTADQGFLAEAMSHRSAHIIKDLPPLERGPVGQPAELSAIVCHSPLAIGKLTTLPDTLDFAQPGEHILVHSGAAEALRFILDTPEFRVRDVPGSIGDDVRLALVQRLVLSGFLTPAAANAAAAA